MSTFLFVLKRFQNRWKGNATQTIKYSLNESQYLSNEMKCCVKFQTAINSSRKMKHGNFKASRAADMYFNNNKKTKQKKKRNLKSVLKIQLSDGGFLLFSVFTHLRKQK